MSTSVLRETDGAVSTLTLNKPERLNTITAQLAQELRTSLAEAQQDDTVRVIRLKGAGRAFCSRATGARGGRLSRGAWRANPTQGRSAATRRWRSAVESRWAPPASCT